MAPGFLLRWQMSMQTIYRIIAKGGVMAVLFF